MNDRPIATVLAAVAAAMFVAAFSAAAVLRPDGATVAGNAPAPASATEETSLTTIAAPSLSQVARLPALHVPKQRKPARKKAVHRRRPAPRVVYTPPAAPAPVVTPEPTPVYTPPVRTAPAPPRSAVGQTFDTSG